MFRFIRSKNIIYKAILAIIFIYFFGLMLRITLDYFPVNSNVSFLMIKQTEVTSRPEYLTIFYVHVYSSIFALMAGFIAVFFDKSVKYLHRFSGRIYVFVTLLLSSLSGIYIGFFANGGLVSKISFVLLGILWFYTTYRSYSEIRKRNFLQHKFWMWRSYALAVSAITLRMCKVILVYLFHPNPMDVYQIIAWLGWVPNLLFVEYLIKKHRMKTNILAACTIFLFLISCKKEAKPEEKGKSDSLISKKQAEQEFHKELYGIYTGDFMSDYDANVDYDSGDLIKKITLKINRITKDSVYGQSIVSGNQRPFRGVLGANANTLILDEPGNDKTDGRFEVKLEGDSLSGNWTAFNKSAVKISSKTLKLAKKEFVYNPNFMLDENTSDTVDWTSHKKKKVSEKNDDGIEDSYEADQQRYASDVIFMINASKEKLTEKGLKNLRKLDLEIIRNTVFARHGYSFKKETYRQFFENTDWYVPVSNNVDADLTPLEKENVALLARLEKYAEDHYDTFGR